MTVFHAPLIIFRYVIKVESLSNYETFVVLQHFIPALIVVSQLLFFSIVSIYNHLYIIHVSIELFSKHIHPNPQINRT